MVGSHPFAVHTDAGGHFTAETGSHVIKFFHKDDLRITGVGRRRPRLIPLDLDVKRRLVVAAGIGQSGRGGAVRERERDCEE